MRVLGNKIKIFRGESFSLRIPLIYENTDELVVLDREWQNPYILISLTSDPYAMDERLINHYWLELDEIPRFERVQPEYIDSAMVECNKLPEGYDLDTCLFYMLDIMTGRKTYVYFDGITYKEYPMELYKKFISDQTQEWNAQIYDYMITLVSGTSTEEFVYTRYRQLYPDGPTDLSIQEMYDAICREDESYLDLDMSSPLINTNVYNIMRSRSKLIVDQSI